MAFAINDEEDIDGLCAMYAKRKLILSPGLVSLLILELVFLVLACYIGVAMWIGLPAIGNTPAIEYIVGVILLLTAFHRQR